MISSNSASVPPRAAGDAYLALLGAVLLGYAEFGKGFAYLGFPPLYIGELTLLIGIAFFFKIRCWIGTVTTVPALLILGAMFWVLLRTVPFINEFGVDAIRDSVTTLYGLFSFVVIALLLEKASRINTIIRYYRSFVNIFAPTSPFLFVASWYMSEILPKLPGAPVPIIYLQPGEIAVHTAGAATFLLVGLQKARLGLVLPLIVSGVIAGTLSRGPLLAELVPISLACLLLGKWRQLLAAAGCTLIIFAAAYVVEPLFIDFRAATSSNGREISTRQVANNLASILGQGDEQGEGTKEWRKQFWTWIVNDTISGPHFWDGRGFGPNLADLGGFRSAHDTPALRDPHNIFMTMLGRGGLPGVTLWAAVLFSTLLTLIRMARLALYNKQSEWAGLFVFVATYLTSMVINASFDPALAAPMLGIWFWCLVGFGIGSIMIYRYQQQHEWFPSTFTWGHRPAGQV